ncbi:MAG: hypothetical protein HY619_03060 [Thaumarchaeota archaeon]|nr:hypothetical protein [Nitrososphaerota archaeon]
MENRIGALERQIEKIKTELTLLGDLRPGSLSEQYNVCGNANCRCKDDPPKRHGPYYQLSFTRKARSRTKFVKKTQLSEVKKQLKNYARLRSLVDRWIELSSELCQLRLEQKE